jgi:uncharacterized repeat protein (TIGR01451 family)
MKGITMRTFLHTVTSKLNPKYIAASLTMLLAAIVFQTATLAWGPERATFTQENPAGYVTFNSITNNPKYGDERNFFRVRDIASNQSYGDDATLVAGKKYEALVFFHNNAKTSLNASGQGVAQNAFARAEMPALVRAGNQNTKAMSYVGASNANPTSVYDHITLKNPSNIDIALRYIPGSAKIASNGAINGQSLGDSAIFSGAGVKLGYDALNGSLPGCDQYSGFITFQFVADQPNFNFVKDVRMNGTKTWADSVSAKPGNTVDYRLSYINTGTTEQKNVVMKDVLPKGLSYVPGSSKLQNANSPNGKAIDDGINAGGVNIGNYAPGANAFLVFSAKVDGKTCETLTNTAAAETNNGNKQDTAKVVIPGENCKPNECLPGIPNGDARCTPAVPTSTLPTTGPVEVIAGLIGVAAITIGIVYYFKSRRELEDALHTAQANPTHTKTSDKK